MILLYFLRYFSIINMNENKMTVYQNSRLGKGVDKLIEWKIRILRATSSVFFSIILLLICYALILIAFTIPLIPNYFVCKFENLVAIKTLHNVLIIMIYFATIMSLVVDMIANYALIIRCRFFLRYMRTCNNPAS
jgi:hypothetical protein